jgi:hypothetical protein
LLLLLLLPLLLLLLLLLPLLLLLLLLLPLLLLSCLLPLRCCCHPLLPLRCCRSAAALACCAAAAVICIYFKIPMRIVLGTLAVSFKSTRVIPPGVVRQRPELLHLMSTDFTSNIVDGRLIIRPPATHAHPAAFVRIPYDFSEKAFISPSVNSDACTYLVGPFLLQLRGVPVFVFCHCRVSVQCFMRTVLLWSGYFMYRDLAILRLLSMICSVRIWPDHHPVLYKSTFSH